MTDTTAQDGHGEEPSRRDFIYIAAAGAAAVGGGLVAWPFINQMAPAADTLALASIRFNYSAVEAGQQVTVMWRGGPVFVRRLTDEEIAAANEANVDALPDPLARNDNLADGDLATTDHRVQENGLIIMQGNCTHLGCVPLGEAGDFGGWFCPCHGSHYDTVGRIRRGPAPENLPIPPVRFEGEAEVVIG